MVLLVVLLHSSQALLALAGNGRVQAHLPLSPGLPLLPPVSPSDGVLYGGAVTPQYNAAVSLGGSPALSIGGALSDVPYAMPQPFHEWDVNHASGPSVFDCPEGFALTERSTCVFVEFRRAEESCPYGSFRDKNMRGCVQIDAVPPDRTCPSGFQYFMRGCIRRTQIPPILTCPSGYQQIESACYSVSTVTPLVKCPPDYMLEQHAEDTLHSCYRDHISQPQYLCPDGVTVRAGSVGSTAQTLHKAEQPGEVWTLSPETPQCVTSSETPPAHTCPTGFKLVSRTDTELRASILAAGGDAGVLDAGDELQCVHIAEYEGSVTCPEGYAVIWPNASAEADLFAGIRCRPENWQSWLTLPTFEQDNLRALKWSEQSSLNASEYVIPDDQKIEFFSEQDDGADFPAVLDRRDVTVVALNGRPGIPKRMKRRDMVMLPVSATGRKLTADKSTMSPSIRFERDSCNAQPISSLIWREETAELDPQALQLDNLIEQLRGVTESLLRRVSGTPARVPICREVQVMPSHLACPSGGRVKCRLALPTEDRQLQSQSKRKTTSPKTNKNKSESNSAKQRKLTDEYVTDETLTLEACIRDSQGTPICELSESLRPADPSCSTPAAVLTTRPFRGLDHEKVRSENWDGYEGLDQLSVNYKVAVCVEREEIAPTLECPFGVGKIGAVSGLCDVLVAQAIESSCPEGYTRASQEMGPFGHHGGPPKNYRKSALPVLPDMTGGTSGICELVEYADYQITCPSGYQRERAKNTATACLAEKTVAPSVVCPPGFVSAGPVAVLDDPKSCMKTIEVAPTVISYPSADTPMSPSGTIDGPIATACVLTKDKRLSCGVERKYHGATDMDSQTLFGNAFINKMETKGRKQLDKYTNPFH